MIDRSQYASKLIVLVLSRVSIQIRELVKMLCCAMMKLPVVKPVAYVRETTIVVDIIPCTYSPSVGPLATNEPSSVIFVRVGGDLSGRRTDQNQMGMRNLMHAKASSMKRCCVRNGAIAYALRCEMRGQKTYDGRIQNSVHHRHQWPRALRFLQFYASPSSSLCLGTFEFTRFKGSIRKEGAH